MSMSPEGLWPALVEHKVRIEGLEASFQRIEARLDHLFWALLGAMAVSAGTLLVILIKHP